MEREILRQPNVLEILGGLCFEKGTAPHLFLFPVLSVNTQRVALDAKEENQELVSFVWTINAGHFCKLQNVQWRNFYEWRHLLLQVRAKLGWSGHLSLFMTGFMADSLKKLLSHWSAELIDYISKELSDLCCYELYLPGKACLERNISTNTACTASSLTLMAAVIKWRADCTTSILIWTTKFGRTVYLVYSIPSSSHTIWPTEGFFLFFRITYFSNFHLIFVLRILLYLECLPFLKSLHHLFALDLTAVCGYWPNKNSVFITPGGSVLWTDQCGHNLPNP